MRIRIRIELKCCIQIRIQIEVNPDPQNSDQIGSGSETMPSTIQNDHGPAQCRIAREPFVEMFCVDPSPALCGIARDHDPALCGRARDHGPALCGIARDQHIFVNFSANSKIF
jgi:hypothetical protein